ncbi:YybH family protein [Micromonospora sp. NPDC047670]|uniref:YybH family protein n=1 Tax=Micromonospora sp. NPDC047670 TaxID=3364252 RepID=UPI00371C2AC2
MSDRPNAYHSPADEADVKQLEELIAGLEDGFNRKDAATLDGRFTADAVLIVPDGTVLRGWTELYEYHTGRLAGAVSDWSTRFSVLSVSQLSPEVAVVHVKQDTTTPDRSFSNHGTVVTVKMDGEWWISAMQNTNVLA